jgi:hypothetical protein
MLLLTPNAGDLKVIEIRITFRSFVWRRSPEPLSSYSNRVYAAELACLKYRLLNGGLDGAERMYEFNEFRSLVAVVCLAAPVVGGKRAVTQGE